MFRILCSQHHAALGVYSVARLSHPLFASAFREPRISAARLCRRIGGTPRLSPRRLRRSYPLSSILIGFAIFRRERHCIDDSVPPRLRTLRALDPPVDMLFRRRRERVEMLHGRRVLAQRRLESTWHGKLLDAIVRRLGVVSLRFVDRGKASLRHATFGDQPSDASLIEPRPCAARPTRGEESHGALVVQCVGRLSIHPKQSASSTESEYARYGRPLLLLEEEGVRHVALFGSVTRGDDLPESDMDVVLDLDPSKNLESLNFRRFNNFFKHRSDAPSTSPPAIA